MTRAYYKGAVGAFIIFDLSNAKTFEAAERWKRDLVSGGLNLWTTMFKVLKTIHSQCDQKKSPNVCKSCPKTIYLEKLQILTPLQKLPKIGEDLGKLIVAKDFKKLPKVQKIAQSGHTVHSHRQVQLIDSKPVRVHSHRAYYAAKQPWSFERKII